MNISPTPKRPPFTYTFRFVHVGWGHRRNHPCQVSSQLVHQFRFPRWSKITISHRLGEWLLQQCYALTCYTVRGGAPAPQFWGFPSICAHTVCRITTKFDVVTHMGRGLVFRLSATPPPKGGWIPALPNFRGSLQFCAHPLSPNTYVLQGNTCGEV